MKNVNTQKLTSSINMIYQRGSPGKISITNINVISYTIPRILMGLFATISIAPGSELPAFNGSHSAINNIQTTQFNENGNNIELSIEQMEMIENAPPLSNNDQPPESVNLPPITVLGGSSITDEFSISDVEDYLPREH